MANNIKGLTVEIGGDTTKLGKALEDVNKKSRDLSSELGQINKLLKMDPGNTELLVQKQKVLADAVANTSKNLETLKAAEKQVQEQFERGEVSEEQVRALQREIIATEGKLRGYEKAVEETADELEQLGKESDGAGKDIKETGDKAKATEDDIDDLGDSLGVAAATGFSALAVAATAAVGAILATAEASREYRQELGKLDTAFQDANFTSKTAYETYSALQGIIGETDQAVEAANHLAMLCTTEEELTEWTDILTGVYAKWGASLQPEALSEAANETARCGTVTGAFADAINWAAQEDETFGVALKENIDFTELSQEQLKELTDTEREEYEAKKAQYEAIEDYNTRVEEAVAAEDKFNIALENCNNEQERQQLITKTLTKLYKGAATEYKRTNKEVIRANEAAEKWSQAVAEIGEEINPVVTDIKEMGVTFLKNANEPMKETADFVRTKLLPEVTKISDWGQKNLPQITTGVAGLTAALVTHKAATLVAELASKGWTVATLAQAAAQKTLNLVMAAGPIGLMTTAIVGVAAAMAAWQLATNDAKESVDALTTEERELMQTADEAAQAFRDQRDATNEALGGITSQMDHVGDLANELIGLGDASGYVQEKDQARAEFIIGQLNEALGTEYSMVGGVIQKYDELTNSISDVIRAKLANSLVEAANADYVTAIQNEASALENLNLKEQDYRAQLDITQRKEQEYSDAVTQYNNALDACRTENDYRALGGLLNTMSAKQVALEAEKTILDEKKTAYDQAALDYGTYHNTIANYEEAQTAVLEGNYQKAVDILAQKGGAYGTYSEKVDAETAKVLDTLYKEAIDAGLEAQRMKENFENGVDGYTEEMVAEAEQGYQDALDAYANAYADAEGVGEDMGSGLSAGMENKRSSLVSKAKSLVSGIISAMRQEADSHSPARKTVDFGEDVGEGAEVGIENKTDDVAKAAQKQAATMIDAYNSQEVASQNALRNIAERRSTVTAANQRAAATANSAILNNILAALERGQIITIDGRQLVGATAGQMDTTLGQRRVLAARGAL